MLPHRAVGTLALLSIGALGALGATGACGPTPSAAAPDTLGFEFVDIAPEVGIDVVSVSGDPRRWYIIESNGCGAGWLDYDGDGDLDLFVGNGQGLEYLEGGAKLERRPTASTRLYRNDTPAGGPARFVDVTDEAGARRSDWINAVAVGDVDSDGDPDLYLGCFGADVLLRNEGGRFVDGTAEAGLGCTAWGSGAAFGDVDRDGDLDLYVANYCEFDLDHPPAGGAPQVYEGVEIGWGPEEENGKGYNPGAPDVFYKNEGGGRFVEATEEAGFVLPKALCSYAAVFCDVDGDDAPDLLVANDLQPCNLFRNQGDGRFVEEGHARGFALNRDGQATAAMGLMVADVDQDGDPDVLRSNFDFEANGLHSNDGRGNFREIAGAVGLADPSMDRLGWGGRFFDADLDGDLDLLVANGHVMPQAAEIGMSGWAQVSQLFEARRDGTKVTWSDATERSGPGLAPKRSARGVACADFDDDGDVDVLIVDLDHAPRLLENRTERRGHWIGVALTGTTSARDGYGAKVIVRAGGQQWIREARAQVGLYSSHDPRLHFGLGALEQVDALEVQWPSGRRSKIESPAADTYHSVVEPEESR